MHFVEEHWFGCALALYDCVDEYGSWYPCLDGKDLKLIIFIIFVEQP